MKMTAAQKRVEHFLGGVDHAVYDGSHLIGFAYHTHGTSMPRLECRRKTLMSLVKAEKVRMEVDVLSIRFTLHPQV